MLEVAAHFHSQESVRLREATDTDVTTVACDDRDLYSLKSAYASDALYLLRRT